MVTIAFWAIAFQSVTGRPGLRWRCDDKGAGNEQQRQRIQGSLIHLLFPFCISSQSCSIRHVVQALHIRLARCVTLVSPFAASTCAPAIDCNARIGHAVPQSCRRAQQERAVTRQPAKNIRNSTEPARSSITAFDLQNFLYGQQSNAVPMVVLYQHVENQFVYPSSLRSAYESNSSLHRSRSWQLEHRMFTDDSDSR
jgi:hypothetical protein